MEEYLITFGDSTVSIHYDSDEAFQFLKLLFGDIPCAMASGETCPVLVLKEHVSSKAYTLTSGRDLLYRGRLGVRCSAVLFDVVIYHLLNRAEGAVALHAGAVSRGGRVILLPGKSGSGKSTLIAWLAAHGYGYLTDELICIPGHDGGQIQFFSRPVCLKRATVSLIRSLIREEHLSSILEDEYGAVLPHRALNPEFSAVASSPALVILPAWEAGSALRIEQVSAAKLCMELMGCHVNARNLENHGFDQISRMSRLLPAYRIGYGDFQGLGAALDNLLGDQTLTE